MPQPPNMNQMLQQVQKMQQDMMAAQEQLKNESVEASAGGGMVKVVVSGDLEVKAITIDPTAIDPEDAELLQDLVLAAVNEALRSAQELAASSKMGGLTGGARRSAAWAASAASGLGGMSACAVYAPADPAAGHRARQAAGHRRRTAQRLAFHILRADAEDANALADAIREVKEKIGLCEICFNLAEGPRCTICSDERRDASVICVVEEPGDVIPIERTHEFRGPLPRARRSAVADRRRRPRGPEARRAVHAREQRGGRARGRARHEPDDDGRGDRAAHRRPPARARAGRHGHAAGQRPAGRRRPRVRRRGHARPRVRRAPRGLSRSAARRATPARSSLEAPPGACARTRSHRRGPWSRRGGVGSRTRGRGVVARPAAEPPQDASAVARATAGSASWPWQRRPFT